MKKFIIFVLLVFFIIPTGCKKDRNIPTPVPPDPKIVYLTFDDGPSPVTPQILEILAKNDILATFFVVGTNVERYPEILKQTILAGHSIGIHSYSHKYKEIYQNGQTLAKDIDLCLRAIKKVQSDFTTNLYRFPGGSFNLSQELKEQVKSLGYNYYDWNASSLDAELKNYDYQDLINACITTSCNRDKIILLSHDSSTKTRTAQALQGIIDYFKSQNYIFKPL